MPAERLSMRKIREVLRLCWGGRLSARAVAQSCGMGRTTVREYVQRAEAAGLSWPLSEGLSDGELEARLFPPAPSVEGLGRCRIGRRFIGSAGGRVTLLLLWRSTGRPIRRATATAGFAICIANGAARCR